MRSREPRSACEPSTTEAPGGAWVLSLMKTSSSGKIGGMFVAIGLAIAGWLSIHDVDRTPYVDMTAVSSASASASAAPSGEAPSLEEEEPPLDGVGGGGGAAPALDEPEPELDDGDGGGPPTLDDAPKSVKFGVILVTYKGAQGASREARSKNDALALAQQLAGEARDDFEAAVKKGDDGSTTNAGRMFRGILEPSLEYALFKLDEGAVSEPVDSPRGYWIAKRLD